MYSPVVNPVLIRPLYRLAKVRGVPMTRVVNEVLSRYLDESKNEIADYDPAIHEGPRRRKTDRRHIEE